MSAPAFGVETSLLLDDACRLASGSTAFVYKDSSDKSHLAKLELVGGSRISVRWTGAGPLKPYIEFSIENPDDLNVTRHKVRPYSRYATEMSLGLRGTEISFYECLGRKHENVLGFSVNREGHISTAPFYVEPGVRDRFDTLYCIEKLRETAQEIKLLRSPRSSMLVNCALRRLNEFARALSLALQ